MSPPQNDMSSITVKPHFFARLRRFLHSKASRKSCRITISDHLDPSKSDEDDSNITKVGGVGEEVNDLVGGAKGYGCGGEDEAVVLQRSVKRLLFGSSEEKETVAEEIARLARDDVRVRKLMAELGVVPALVAMVGTAVDGRRRAAVKALVELANGSFTNKALMVEAGILSKLPNNVVNLDHQTILGFAELLFSLSSLSKTQFPISSSQTAPFLVSVLESTSATLPTKELCLSCLTNLASVLENASTLVSHGAVDALLKLSSSKKLSETALEALALLAVTSTGRQAVESCALVPERLIEVLTWEEMPKCQELSAYVLMILAHQSSAQRTQMGRSGIVPVLLEVSLMGSPLAQKRALKLLQWFKDERNMRMGPHSGPQARLEVVMGSPENEKSRAQEAARKMMRSLVQQSLNKNMETIRKRANVGSTPPSNLKTLVISTSSKSLPY